MTSIKENGYFTLAELKEIEKLESANPDKDNDKSWNGETFHEILISTINEMEHYGMELINVYTLVRKNEDEWTTRVIDKYKIRPHIFGTNQEFMGISETSAPNFRDADCCLSCTHCIISEDYSDDLRCKIHTETCKVYKPFMKIPLEPFDHQVCDNYIRKSS